MEAEKGVQKNDGEGPDEEGWTMVIPRWRRMAYKQRSNEKVWEDSVPKDSNKGYKYKWVARADLMQDWRKNRKGHGAEANF